MFAKKKIAKRFSLLLLEDEEDYVADWVVSCNWPSNIAGNWQGLPIVPGRLRLCTRSMFFDPDDIRVPIARLEFASVAQLDGDGPKSFTVVVNKVTKMKPNMADVPYTVDKGTHSTWVFSLMYAQLDSFMPLAQEQLVMSRLPAPDRLELLDAAVKAREDAANFDTSRLVDFSERVVWEGPATQLSPLVREPGRLAVTDQRLYFQPLHNIAGDTPVRSHPLAAVAAVVRRRSSLRPVGLELFLLCPNTEAHLQQHLLQYPGPYWDASSVFFTFRSETDREKVLTCITQQPQLGVAVGQLMPAEADRAPTTSADTTVMAAPGRSQLQAVGQLLEATCGWLQRVMAAWQHGKVSNFDYLLYLNLAAGRSFNDLAQWPVFPWVLRDYKSAQLDLADEGVFRDLSKPMGAMTPARLEVFRQRFHDMESIMQHVDAAGDMPKPFMYGTHYSTPGYVMFWLVRAAPGHMLRLQAGRFDAPDRLFNSLQECWHSATTSTTDVKELIPEFYMPGGDFLVNGSQLALGIRQNGRAVNDVELPPWASNPDDLLAKHRAALESPYVSAHLHHWIDLIFGYKQTGAAAVDADNVFYHLTYEGAVDISQVKCLRELKALETQINEFGQTPKQLFPHPHPPRLVQPEAPDAATIYNNTVSSSTENTVSDHGIISIGQQVGSRSSSSSSIPAALQAHSGSSSSSKAARLKGGGEDAAGGAICYALVSAILAAAAAAPDAQLEDAAHATAHSAAAAAATGCDRDVMETGLRLSPVSDIDLLSAVPSAVNKTAGQAPPGIGAKQISADTASIESKQPQQQQQQQANPSAGGLRGMLTRLTDSASAAAGSAAASVASAVQGSGISSNSNSANAAGSNVMGLGVLPGKVSASGMKLSLSWMQQQFAEGLSLSSSKEKVRSGRSSPAPAQQSPVTATAACTAGSQLLRSTSPPTPSASAEAASGSSRNMQQQQQWPSNLPDKLLVKKSVRLQSEPVSAVAATSSGNVFCVGHNGLLRVLQTPQLTTYRAAKSEQDLLCISLLPAATAGFSYSESLIASPSKHSSSRLSGIIKQGAGQAEPAGGLSGSSALKEEQLPLLVAGCQSGSVLVYAAAPGRVLGSWDAHGDSVSCVLQLGAGGSRTVTGSYDCSVKVWDVNEGRQPWSSTLPLPCIQLRDLDSSVWAMSASTSGQLLVTGTDEGLVAAWDLRTQHQIWATQVSSDYVGGTVLLPGGNHVAAAAADGTLSILEWRRAGVSIATASCGAPLRCCTSDGHLMICGTETGQLMLWNLDQLLGQQPAGSGFSLAGPDGAYPPVTCPSKAAVNGVAVSAQSCGLSAEQGTCNVAAALDDGLLVLFSNA